MLTVLASLAFAAATLVAVAAMRTTWLQYRDIALGNIAAQGSSVGGREFRVTFATLARKPARSAGSVIYRPQGAAVKRRSIRTPARRAAA